MEFHHLQNCNTRFRLKLNDPSRVNPAFLRQFGFFP
ncbi:MAG: PTS transporter subunit EIIB [Bacteroidales bacterium]|nr:PTS transporter subunit EIIB [Bacteroidales bacterium]